MLSKSLVNRLLKRGKVQSVAILDLDGHVEMHSEDLDLSSEDIHTILSALKAGYNSCGFIGLMRLSLLDKTFTCMPQCSSDDDAPVTLVGRADDLMFASVKTSKCVVVGLSDLQSPGSCIYEISETAKALELRAR